MRFPPFADLDKDQRKIYSEAPTQGALLVTGPPGTGKTVIAMHRALRLAADERPVTSVMFRKVLSKYTSNFDGMPPNVSVTNAHQWAPRWYKGGFGKSVPKIDRFTFDWKAIRTTIKQCTDVEVLKKLSWGHLIIDEGQDFSVAMYKALMALVKHRTLDEDDRPTLTVFADENQTIHEENCTIVDLIEELNATVRKKRLWRLDKNYRNSKEIALFTRHFQVRGASSVRLPERETQSPLILMHQNANDPIDQIVRFATNFGGIEIGVIVFGRKNDIKHAYLSILKQVEQQGVNCRVQGYSSGRGQLPINDIENLIFDVPPSITVVHSQSAKGLEFDVVFLLNIDALNPRDGGELDSFKKLYVAGSRARDRLFLLINGDVEGNSIPDAMRLLPAPDTQLCKYHEVDLDMLLDSVEWCDSASQFQRAKLQSDGLIDELMKVDKKILVKKLQELAIRSFYQQATATIVEERVENKNDLLDLVVELGPAKVRSTILSGDTL